MNRTVTIILAVAAVVIGAIFLTRTTPASVSGGGAGLQVGQSGATREEPKSRPPGMSQTEPLQVSVTPLPLTTAPAKSAKTTEMELNGQRYHLLVADEPSEWEQGLMNRTQLDGFDGMAFVFPKAESRTFWNKNTHLNLIVIWAHDTDVLGAEALPSIEKTKTIKSISSPGPVNRVIELVVR